MRKLIFQSCCIAVTIWICQENLVAEEKSASSQYPPCTREELMLFFPEGVVKNVLVQANFSEEESEGIAKELGVKDRGIAKLVDQKAAQYQPNPFKELSQRDQAIKIYQETVFEVFANVLKEHGIKDENQIRSLLEEIRLIKSKIFIDCISKQPRSSKASARP